VAATDISSERARRDALIAAEKQAETLFDAIERAGLVRPSRTERAVEDDICALALRKFGVEKHWHKRIVRAGSNTLTIGSVTPPIRSIEADDVVYVHLGPVFEDPRAGTLSRISRHHWRRTLRVRAQRRGRRRMGVRRRDCRAFGERIPTRSYSGRQGVESNQPAKSQIHA
jgi:hypothetical protein